MNILVINCGSSSIKYQLIDIENEQVLTKGLADRIGLSNSKIEQKTPGMDKFIIEEDMKDHVIALEYLLEAIVDTKYGAIKSMDEIDAVGHRVVHGGEKISSSVIIDDNVMEIIENCVELAPIHNPPNIMGINACKKVMPDIPMVGVFDTAFHQTMDAEAFIYALPYKFYEKYGIRRYGFHGTSHKYVTERTAEILEKKKEDLNIITCHLGNGSSITGVEKGKSKVTSMGFTPLAGVSMGTRSGDVDPAIITFLMEKEGMSFEDINRILNKESGVLGISEISSDFRDLQKSAEEGNEQAKLALDVFIHDVKKYIGAYMAIVENVDTIVFTAGIGENSDYIRQRICEGMESLGIEIDVEKNKTIRGEEGFINGENSRIKILVVPTDEELMIAQETAKVIK